MIRDRDRERAEGVAAVRGILIALAITWPAWVALIAVLITGGLR